MKTLLFFLPVISIRAAILTVPGTHTTVQSAVNAARTGDVIQLSGTFAEEVSTKAAQPGVTLAGGTIHRLGLYKPDWTVRDVKFAGWKQNITWANLVTIYPNAHRTTLKGLIVDAAGTQSVNAISWNTDGAGPGPFPASIASDCVISGCVISNVKGYTGLVLMGNRNVVKECLMKDFVQSDFVRLWGDSNVIQDCVFDGNKFAPEGTVGFHADFIQTFGNNGYGSQNHVIERCTIKNIEGQITQLEQNGVPSITNWTFRNNIFQNISLGASITQTNTKWLNNVFNNIWPAGGHALNYGNSFRGSSDGQVITGNIFLDCGKPTTNEMGWYGDGTELSNFPPAKVSANFNYFGKGADFKPARTDSSQARFRWSEPNGINGGDPKLTPDFRLKEGSPLIGKGPKGTDIGAYPYAVLNLERVVERSTDGGKTWNEYLKFTEPADQLFRIK